MTIEEIDKWLDNEYGVSYTSLEKIHDWLIDENQKKDKEIEKLNNIINELDSWLKEKKEQMEEFELYKRKETGAFWYSTMGNIDTFIEKIKELKGDNNNGDK